MSRDSDWLNERWIARVEGERDDAELRARDLASALTDVLLGVNPDARRHAQALLDLYYPDGLGD